MYPAYPHHANMMHYAPNIDDQRAKEMQSHMKMDPFTMNSPYQPWPYGGNYCYPAPHEYHGCCNHGYFGGGPYSFRPSYTHYPPPPPPPPFHSHGFYPPFPGAYPPYSVPPPHYSIEQPRYDYEKNAHAPHHCCGCNHREEEKKPKMEQKEPEVDKKTSDSLVPFISKDYPYPIMYVPRYMNNESNTKEKEKHSHDPVELKPLEHSDQDRKRENTRRDQEDGDSNSFPFPIFWLPLKNDDVGKDTKENDRNLVAQNGLPDVKNRFTMENDEAESDMISKHAVQKVIPVKQLEKEEGKKIPTDTEKKGKGVEEKASPKTSKLPPVCLRLDPLPRKKKGSRSPSPPRDKERSKETPMEKPKSSHQETDSSTQGLKKSKEEQSKGNIKTIEVKSDVNKVEKDGVSVPCENVQGQSSKGEPCQVGEKKKKSEPCKVEEKKKKGEPCEVEEKKKLSENEAALMIQSWYRGFEVRKSQPLMKLKKISEVGKQVVELRNRIQDLESSSSTIGIDEKQKLIIGETIMSLLLKLDTIQGLHPIVRDIRKSVAKELVGLQEKLDSLKPVTKTMHPEDDAIREKSCSDQTEPQLDSDVKLVENHEVEHTESQDNGGSEACNTDVEPQVELQNEASIGDCNNNQLQEQVEIEQLVDDDIQEKSDEVQAESGINVESMESEHHEVEASESRDDGGDTKQVESESEQNTVEPTNNKLQMLETMEQEKSNQTQAQTESDVEYPAKECPDDVDLQTRDNKCIEVGSVEVEKDVSMETKAELLNEIQQDFHEEEAPKEDDTENSIEVLMEELPNKQLEISETVEQDKSDEAQVHHEVDAKELNNELMEVGSVDLKAESAKEEAPREVPINGIQEDFVVSTEEAPKVDDIESSMEDVGGASPVSSTGSHESSDKKLVEENEKLRVAVEELMKAGNQQLDVIKELTGRVKDLEKKLSKNKKVKVKKGRSRASHVDVKEELRSCIV